MVQWAEVSAQFRLGIQGGTVGSAQFRLRIQGGTVVSALLVIQGGTEVSAQLGIQGVTRPYTVGSSQAICTSEEMLT